MTILARIAVAAGLAAMSLAAPASAQDDYYFTRDVAFFERVPVGDIEVTPFGVVRDSRCADERFCFREDTLIVSVILHDYGIIQEVVLELNRPAAVPGGYLVLRDAGTRPVRRGAIPLKEYELDLEYVPFD